MADERMSLLKQNFVTYIDVIAGTPNTLPTIRQMGVHLPTTTIEQPNTEVDIEAKTLVKSLENLKGDANNAFTSDVEDQRNKMITASENESETRETTVVLKHEPQRSRYG